MTPTTDDEQRWQEHYNATKDKRGEPWTGHVAAYVTIIIVVAILAGCATVYTLIMAGAL